MRKTVVIILLFLSIIALLLRFGQEPLGKALGLKSRAGLRITTSEPAKILIDGKEMGSSPFEDQNLTAGKFLITVKLISEASPSGKISWQGYVDLYPGTLTVLNRELANFSTAQSGELITLGQGKGVTVVSIPTDAEVIIDGKSRGRSPLSLRDISEGEHLFIINKDGYLKRNIKPTIVDGFNLTLSVDLAISEIDLTRNPTIPISATARVVVKSTPTGFLRVRSLPNADSNEVSRVKPGETLTLLEEVPNWNRVRLSDGKEGYVSSSYTEKKN